MPKSGMNYQCTECGHKTSKWVGRCPNCREWETIVETASTSSSSVGLKSTMKATTPITLAQPVTEIRTDRARHSSTGISEFDRVLGGGFVAGGVILLAGEPGAGKSTLILEICSKAAADGKKVLYASGEESAEQIKLRADRVNANHPNLYIASETNLNVILGHIENVKPDLLILDSVQTVASPDIEGRAGGVTQVMEVASVITRIAKNQGIPTVLIGQVTKNDEIGGPRQLEHLTDVVLMLEGDKNTTLRFLRGIKNRYGPADEIGCFVHTSNGLEEVNDPSGLFLGNRTEPVPGTCVTVVVEGKRPLVAEVQALVKGTHLPVPRREVSGLDKSRLAMTQAVVEQHGKVRLYDQDVYCATVGGMRIQEPTADLAIALAIASARADVPMKADMLALGEVALSGDIRPVHDIERRLVEAGRMGFRVAMVPEGTAKRLGKEPNGNEPVTVGKVRLIEVGSISRAVNALAAMQTPSESNRKTARQRTRTT